MHKVIPPGAPEEARLRIDAAGLTARERRDLLRSPGNLGEVLDFMDTNTGRRFLLDIALMKEAIAHDAVPYKVGYFVNTLDGYLTLIQSRGVEEQHLNRLDKRRLEVPVIYVTWPDGSYVLVDGVHRFVKRLRSGLRETRTIILQFPVWRAFLIDHLRGRVTDAAGAVIPDLTPELARRQL